MSDDLSIPNAGYQGNRTGRYGTGHGRGRPGMDPDTRRLMMFACCLGIVLLALVGASALIGHHSNTVPVILADSHPIRVRPENPGGMKIDGAENDIFSGGSDTANARLAPPAEKPDTKALRTAEAPPLPIITPNVPAEAPPAPLTVTRSPVVASAPVVKPGPVAVAKPPVATTEAQPPKAADALMVQLAALDSEAAAHTEWQQLMKRLPALLDGRQPSFSRTERDGHSFWRLRTSGFTDGAQARGFCAQVRAKGSSCSVADF